MSQVFSQAQLKLASERHKPGCDGCRAAHGLRCEMFTPNAAALDDARTRRFQRVINVGGSDFGFVHESNFSFENWRCISRKILGETSHKPRAPLHGLGVFRAVTSASTQP